VEYCYFDDYGKHWRLPCSVGENAIVSCRDRPMGLGAVLILTKFGQLGQSECLMVRKSPRLGYRNSDKWAFPGGMIRLQGHVEKPLGEVIVDSLRKRVMAEAGLEVVTLAPAPIQTPLVAGYAVKGVEQHTLVSPLGLSLEEAGKLQDVYVSCQDPSVSEVEWIDPRTNWSEIAPANLVFAARALWHVLSEHDKRDAQEKVEQALKQCNGWATEMRLHQTPSPYAALGKHDE
jgi:ADP-ribose pyrophosphatase YjhB (NUDIX family)